jgi:ribonuclease HII
MMGVAGMAVLVGIDEAGFGPILGPLVVSSCILSLPHNHLTSDLWQILARSTGSRRKRLGGRLLITDSKKAYNKAVGVKHLERTVLTVMKCLGKEPATLAEFIELLCPSCLERLSNYPWYKGAENHFFSVNVADTAIASNVLSDDLLNNRIELQEVRSCCLDVEYYNKMVTAVKNKASVLFTATSQLIQMAFDNFAGEDLHIIIDRQGGRMRYLKNLQRMFPYMELTIIRESPEVSIYELRAKKGAMRLHFEVGADEKYLPVSLASMVSKYLRELLIGCINRFFADFSPNLKPTAGYWTDGLRFIKDLKTSLPHIRINRNQLIRCR